MTGGGSVFRSDGARFTHGFELHRDTSLPNNLGINWGKKPANKFHHTKLLGATHIDTALDEGNPVAGFDTYFGVGSGRLNGIPGVPIIFKFTDAGEPGKGADLAQFTIDGLPIVSNTPDKGNQ